MKVLKNAQPKSQHKKNKMLGNGGQYICLDNGLSSNFQSTNFLYLQTREPIAIQIFSKTVKWIRVIKEGMTLQGKKYNLQNALVSAR